MTPDTTPAPMTLEEVKEALDFYRLKMAVQSSPHITLQWDDRRGLDATITACLHHLETAKRDSEDDEPYGVKICRNVIFYACFSHHTDTLKAGEMKAAIAVLFPPEVVDLASKPPAMSTEKEGDS